MRNDELLLYLIRGGISPRRARRILREFDEHHADIVAERIQLGDSAANAHEAADARLGTPLSLVVRMLMRPELQSWARRRPWAAFALVPLLGYCALFVITGFAVVGVLEYAATAATLNGLATCSSFLLRFVVPAAAAVMLAREAARRRERTVWPWVGLALLCLVGASASFDFTPHVAAHEGNISIGFGFDADRSLEIVLRAALTALLGALPYVAWRRREASLAS
jgi:hypothetical protein